MPFVRYKNGDRATLTKNTCKCGRGLPMMANVNGRILDLVKTRDGRYVAGDFSILVMFGSPPFRNSKFTETRGDKPEIRSIPAGERLSSEDKVRLAQKTRERVGSAMRITVREGTQIPP